MLEGCDFPYNGSDTLMILSAWSEVRDIVSISGGGVASHSFGEISSLPQTYMVWIFCVFWKELKKYEMI